MTAKTVMITGTSSGFGKSAAALFAARGWNVIRTMRDLRTEGERADHMMSLRLDVTDPASIAEAVQAGVQRFGRIDVLVNNAGAGLFSVFEATPDATARAIFETNVFGLFNMVRAILPVFETQGGGRLVNVSSAAAFVPTPLMSVYAASKQAVDAFSESVSHELASRHVTVKLVEPGMVAQTGFVQQTIAASSAAPTPPAYQAFYDQIFGVLMGFPPGLVEADVAEAIYAAACDESDQLRFVIGDDARQYEHARHEMSEPKYLAWVRGLFTPETATAGSLT